MKNYTIGINSATIAMLMVISSAVHAITPISVTASSNDGNVEQNTIDNDFTTRWSANGNNGSQWLQYVFAGVPQINAVNIAFHKGDKRSTRFQVHSSSDGQNWNIELSARSSSKSNRLEKFTFDKVLSAPYIRIIGFGNSKNTWNSISEVSFQETQTIPRLSNAVAISSADDGNPASNVLDGSFDTRWSAEGSGQWIRLDLGSERAFNNVQLSFHRGYERKSNFSIEISSDDRNWRTIMTQTSNDGFTDELETFPFSEVTARYVRFTGYGNQKSNWNSLNEFTIVPLDGAQPVVALAKTTPVATPKVVAAPAPKAVPKPVPVAVPVPVAAVPVPVTSAAVYPVTSDLSPINGINCTLTVTNTDELRANTGWNMPAGTTVCLADGIYDSVDLQIGGAGTREYPVTVAAITQGNVFFQTKARIRVAGSHIVLKGIIFQNGYSISRDLIKTSSSGCKYCRLSEITIQNWDADKNKKWFSSWNL